MYSLDVDIGGTFTDGFFTNGEAVKTAKVLTTPHDVTEGFIECIRFGSRLFDEPLDAFLRRTAVARLSTTIGTNLLVQQKGARIGLLVTAGAEASLYGANGAAALGKLIKPEMVLGIDEAVDDAGEVARPVDAEQVLARVRDLIGLGAQLIVVSLRNAWRNSANEQAVRRIVRERYPIHYLRSVPVQIGIEVVHDRDDHARTNSALLNAYIHAEMARVLFRAEDRLRDSGYERPLLIVHASGGNARVAKTIALNTLHSGPAVAVRGAAVLAQRLALDQVVSTDMGGTSFDVGFVAHGAAKIETSPRIEDVPIATPAIQVNSIGLGGGSIATAEAGALKVGPESAGSAPGPVCYGKGGASPTVTDANVVLGFIDPDFFLGGRMKLDLAAARRALERRLARTLGCSIEEAAFDVRALANAQMADEISRSLVQAGFAPAEHQPVLGRRRRAAACLRHRRARRIAPGGRVPVRVGVQRLRRQHHRRAARLSPRVQPQPGECRCARTGAARAHAASRARHAGGRLCAAIDPPRRRSRNRRRRCDGARRSRRRCAVARGRQAQPRSHPRRGEQPDPALGTAARQRASARCGTARRTLGVVGARQTDTDAGIRPRPPRAG